MNNMNVYTYSLSIVVSNSKFDTSGRQRNRHLPHLRNLFLSCSSVDLATAVAPDVSLPVDLHVLDFNSSLATVAVPYALVEFYASWSDPPPHHSPYGSVQKQIIDMIKLTAWTVYVPGFVIWGPYIHVCVCVYIYTYVLLTFIYIYVLLTYRYTFVCVAYLRIYMCMCCLLIYIHVYVLLTYIYTCVCVAYTCVCVTCVVIMPFVWNHIDQKMILNISVDAPLPPEETSRIESRVGVECRWTCLGTTIALNPTCQRGGLLKLAAR